jgi:putative toxin-antitoxin system antitoxin component (TIGR02293 family)
MTLASLYKQMDDPRKEIAIVRKGIAASLAEAFLERNRFAINDILKSLDIPRSTFFDRTKKKARLNQVMTEKFVRLFQIVRLAKKVLGEKDGLLWLKQDIPSLGNQRPLDLLDTESGHRLSQQALLQVQHGIYG